MPDVLDKFEPQPDLKFGVRFGDHVAKGELSPSTCSRPPKVSYDADRADLYTLALVDPDAPSRANPENREWRHWCMYIQKSVFSDFWAKMSFGGSLIICP